MKKEKLERIDRFIESLSNAALSDAQTDFVLNVVGGSNTCTNKCFNWTNCLCTNEVACPTNSVCPTNEGCPTNGGCFVNPATCPANPPGCGVNPCVSNPGCIYTNSVKCTNDTAQCI